MKIDTKAKPIRIRIISGGEEHSSLDSLCKNLNVEDIFPLVKDKRLSRWLRQKGEKALAEKVDNLPISSSDNEPNDRIYFNLLEIFLSDEIKLFKVIDIYKLYSSWHDSTLSKSNNYRFLQKYLLNRKKGIIFLFSFYSNEFSDQEWNNLLDNYKGENDPQIEKIKNEINAKLQKQAKEEIADWKRNPAYYEVDHNLNEGEKLTDLKKFLQEISENLFKRYGTLIFYETLDSLPDSTFKGYNYIKKSDFFYKEKKFLWAFTGYCSNWNVAVRRKKEEVFKELARDYKYPLAELMLKSNPEEYQIDGVNFTRVNASTQLKFIVGHLFKY